MQRQFAALIKWDSKPLTCCNGWLYATMPSGEETSHRDEEEQPAPKSNVKSSQSSDPIHNDLL
jgi:hypothetical protein